MSLSSESGPFESASVLLYVSAANCVCGCRVVESVVGDVLSLLVLLLLFGSVCVGPWCLRGEPSIIRSICRCVRFKRFSSSTVSVQEVHAYNTVGVTVPWNSLILLFKEYDLVVSSRLSK